MKKTLAFLLTFALCLSTILAFSACGKDEEPQTPTEPSVQVAVYDKNGVTFKYPSTFTITYEQPTSSDNSYGVVVTLVDTSTGASMNVSVSQTTDPEVDFTLDLGTLQEIREEMNRVSEQDIFTDFTDININGSAKAYIATYTRKDVSGITNEPDSYVTTVGITTKNSIANYTISEKDAARPFAKACGLLDMIA